LEAGKVTQSGKMIVFIGRHSGGSVKTNSVACVVLTLYAILYLIASAFWIGVALLTEIDISGKGPCACPSPFLPPFPPAILPITHPIPPPPPFSMY
jgi:hypothetical protein